MKDANQDPELLAYANKVKLPISFTSGEEMQELFIVALNQSPETRKIAKELTQPEK